MADGYDGRVKIDTKIDEKGFDRGVRNLRLKMIELRATVKAVFANLPNAVKAFTRVGLESIKNFGVMAAGFLKKALIGTMFLFALTLAKIFASMRESIGELISIRGGTLAKDVEDVKNKFTELRMAVASAFLPLIEIAIPYIKQALDWLIQLFNKVAMITAAFAGQKQVLQVLPGSAAKYAKATKDTEKAARGALAAFDQIDVLQKQKADGATPRTVDAEMVPITENILAKVQEIKSELANFANDPKGAFLSFIYWDTWVAFVKAKWQEFKNFIFLDNWTQSFADGVQRIKDLFTGLWAIISNDNLSLTEKIKAIWLLLVTWFAENIRMPWVDQFKMLGDFIGLWVLYIVGLIKQKAEDFRNGFGTALDWIAEKFRTVFEGVRNFVFNIVNKILGFINDMINAILAGISTVVSAASSVSGSLSVPSAGGGISGAIGGLLGSIRIPRLATGAVIPPNSNFVAMLGDQKSGTNVEAPLETIKQALAEVLGGQGGGGDITIYLDGEVIYKMVKKKERQHGTSLVSGGVTG